MKRNPFYIYYIGVLFLITFTAQSQEEKLFLEIANQYCEKYTKVVKNNILYYDSHSILNEVDTIILHTHNNPSFGKLWATLPNDTASRKYISRKIFDYLIDNCPSFRQYEKIAFTDTANIKYYEAINKTTCNCYADREKRLRQEGQYEEVQDSYLQCVTGVLKKSEALAQTLKEKKIDVTSTSFLSQLESYSFNNCLIYRQKRLLSLVNNRVSFVISKIVSNESKQRVSKSVFNTNTPLLLGDFVDKQAYENALINLEKFKNNVKLQKYYFTDNPEKIYQLQKYYFTDNPEKIYWGSADSYWFEYRNKQPFFLGRLSVVTHTDYGTYKQKVKALKFTERKSFNTSEVKKFETQQALMNKEALPPPPKILLPAFPK